MIFSMTIAKNVLRKESYDALKKCSLNHYNLVISTNYMHIGIIFKEILIGYGLDIASLSTGKS